MRADWEREVLIVLENEGWPWESTKDAVLESLAVLEPLIRADEREQRPDIPTVTRAAMEMAIPMVYDMLRAQVEALPVQWQALGTAWVRRDDVLALLGDQR